MLIVNKYKSTSIVAGKICIDDDSAMVLGIGGFEWWNSNGSTIVLVITTYVYSSILM